MVDDDRRDERVGGRSARSVVMARVPELPGQRSWRGAPRRRARWFVVSLAMVFVGRSGMDGMTGASAHGSCKGPSAGGARASRVVGCVAGLAVDAKRKGTKSAMAGLALQHEPPRREGPFSRLAARLVQTTPVHETAPAGRIVCCSCRSRRQDEASREKSPRVLGI
ncbi:hypothetical protein BKA80DRAFT_282958 [Phyllosticta citrichinensis]